MDMNQYAQSGFYNSEYPTNERDLTVNAVKNPVENDNIQKLLNFKPSGKQMECLVIMLDGSEKIFSLDRSSYGQQLFEIILEYLGINEREYFGITYKDGNKDKHWLECAIKISNQMKNKQMVFEFQVKYYPPEIGMIKTNITKYYLALQIRQDICCGKLPCSYYVYLTLAAYFIQSDVGDYNYEIHNDIDYIKACSVAPFKIQTLEFMEELMEWHKLHQGLTAEEADECLLENATKMALYGFDFHQMKNTDAEDVVMGVNHAGIVIFNQKCRMFKFAWYRLIRVKYREKKLIITIRGLNEFDPNKKLKFKCVSVNLAERAYKAVIDHHFFFRRTGFNNRLKEFKERKLQEIDYRKKKQLLKRNTSSGNDSKAISAMTSLEIRDKLLDTVRKDSTKQIVNQNNHIDKSPTLKEPKPNQINNSEHKVSRLLQSIENSRNHLAK